VAPQLGEYVAFDLLELDGEDLRSIPYIERYGRLWSRLQGIVKIAPLYQGADAKFAMLLGEREANGEGVVFKRLDAPYMPGRKGTNVKIKFWESATVRVCDKKKQDGHASFAVEVLRFDAYSVWASDDHPQIGSHLREDGISVPAHKAVWKMSSFDERTQTCQVCDCDRLGQWYPVGTVTLTKTAEIPESGTYREIKYLYVGAGGRLYQPEDLGPRTDVDASDCTWAQLKQKQEVRRLAA